MENKGHRLFIDVRGDKTMGCTTASVNGSLHGESVAWRVRSLGCEATRGRE
jgi:hypothetical protein